jgi:hypothetical protein
MAAYLLYYRETSRVESTNSYMKRMAFYHGMKTIVIDRKGDMPGSVPRFPTINEAMADPRFKDLTWVWLSLEDSDGFLDEYKHPEENVIYCIGSDFDGFDGKDPSKLPGEKLRLRQIEKEEGEWYATTVIPLVAYDRFLYLQGRRK